MLDVVIVGGGLAGITASREVTQQGLSATVLEARDRIGGRAWSEERLGLNVELGGNFVHWTNSFLWREARRHGLRIAKGLDAERIYWVTCNQVKSGTPEEFFELLRPGMDQMVADAVEHFPYPYDVYTADISQVDCESFTARISRLDLSEEQRDIVSAINAYGSQDQDKQSVSQLLRLTSLYSGAWETMFMAGDTWRLVDGTTELVRAIAAESTADIRISMPVATIEDLGDSVRVVTDSGEELTARMAIVAVPINAAGEIDFVSGLPEPAQSLFDNGHSNRGYKVWIRARGHIEPFRAHVPHGQGPLNLIMTEYRVDDDTLIVAFGNVDSTVEMTDQAALQEALRRFVPDIEVIAIDGHDWASDKYAQGTWVMLDTGQLSQNLPVLRHPHGRLWFAGGDIADGFPSWMDGAIESGTLTAGSVVKALASAET